MADERAAEQADGGTAETAVSQPHDKYFQRVFSNEQDAASLLRTCDRRGNGAGVADRDDGDVSGSAGGVAGVGDAVDRGVVPRQGVRGVAKHVEYVLATQPEAQRKVFSEALRRNVPGRGGEVMNYVEEIIERGRREGRQEGRREGELKGQVRAIEGFVARDIPWPTIEAATGIDEATFRRLRQRVDAKDNGTESTV